jgi:hypothetical protein
MMYILFLLHYGKRYVDIYVGMSDVFIQFVISKSLWITETKLNKNVYKYISNTI